MSPFPSGTVEFKAGRLVQRAGFEFVEISIQEQEQDVKTILLMRHAKAGETQPSHSDFDRSLTDKGIGIARRTGICLQSLDIRIDRVIASSAVRTQQTAEIVASEACPSAPIVLLESLYLATPELYAQSIREEPLEDDSCILVVGHNPGIAELMCRWANQGLEVRTSTLTVFRSEATAWKSILEESVVSGLKSVIQKGHVVWQEPSIDVPVEPAD